MILFVRTDSENAEFGLVEAGDIKIHMKWKAGRELSKGIYKKIEEALGSQKIDWQDISGVIFYEGPGSFTGLRIGAAVSNSLANELDVPIAQTSGEAWIEQGLSQLKADPKKRLASPKYGREPHVTKPRK